ncbi:MAG: serine hydrolase domain-containing protein [Geminicoccales bacterium]
MSAQAAVFFDPSEARRWIERELDAERMFGCGLEVVIQGHSVYREAFGSRSPKGGDPMTEDTRFWIASMTKPVVSVAALHLIEHDELSLEDPVSTFVPGFGDAGVLTRTGDLEPVDRPPTVLDLFTHLAGTTYGQFGSDEIHKRYAEADVYNFSSNNAEMAARLAALPLLHQPGMVFEYGMSTDLLGRVIEVVTGQSLDSVLQDAVLGPLGMSSTSFVADQDRLAELPPSAIQANVAPDFARLPSWHSGGAGLFSTVPDYIQFARMLRGRGTLGDVQILKPETLDLMCRQHLPPGVGYGDYTGELGIAAPWPENGLSFGLGVAVRVREHESIPGRLGEVFWPGVSGCNFWVDPKNDLIVVFLTHAPLHRTTHRIDLRDAIYSGMRDERVQPRAPPTTSASDVSIQ